jgi:pimeloyl-ACP methyl ester carboxylesterase
MKGMFLYGIYCTADVWNGIRDDLTGFDIDYVTYPHEVTRESTSACDIARWVYSMYGNNTYDFVLGHSMGGVVALELAVKLGLKCRRILLCETNLMPAKPFYRNLMTSAHMEAYGPKVKQMLQTEVPYYRDELKKSLQEDFDYTDYIKQARQKVFAVYGDRGQKVYPDRLNDLCLPDSVIGKISFSFVKDACHMPMIENPQGFSQAILNILRRPV